MLLSDVAELYDLLVEYKGCTADYMVSLTKGNWTIAEGGYGRMWELYYEAEKKPTAYAENGVIIVVNKNRKIRCYTKNKAYKN